MNAPILFTVGTPHGQWAAWATALLGRSPVGQRLALPAFTAWHAAVLGAGGDVPPTLSDAHRGALAALPPPDAEAGPWGGVDARACWTLNVLAQRFPDAHYLVFVESPAVGLATALASGRPEDPGPWLAGWCAAAQRVLRHAQRDPTRCLLVDADEAQRHPQAFVAACAARFDVTLAVPPASVPAAAVDPLSRALGEALASADHDVQAVFAELQASCVLLCADESTLPLADSLALRIDGSAAVRHLHDLHALKQSAAHAADVLAALQARADSDLKAAREEDERLRLHLHQVQTELELALLARRDADGLLADAQAEVKQHAAQITHLSQAHEQHGQQLKDTQDRLAHGEAEQQRLTQARDHALLEAKARSAELGAARLAVQSARQESELLLLQLRQAQEELEGYFLENGKASALQRQVDQLTSAQSTLDQTDSELREENEGLRVHLHQVQTELELVLLERRDAEKLLAGAQVDAKQAAVQIRRLSQAHEQQEQQLKDAQARLATAAAEQRQLSQARDRALLDTKVRSAELGAARLDVQSARQESELLLLQLHQVQEELGGCLLANHRLEHAVAAAESAAGTLDLSIAELLPVTERDTPPHRELTFVLRQVKLGSGREIPEATVRLIEHHGHPGLVVFADARSPQLLECWRESGREEDHPYMLLVPSDAHSQPMFEAMASADWLLIRALVVRLETQLHERVVPLAPHWRHLARRLREQLQEMPCRFRFGTLEVEPLADADGGTDTQAIHFGQVSYGVRQLQRLTLHWRPAGPNAGLELLRDADAGPALPSWPDDEHGTSPDRLRLPLGTSDEDTRRQWARLPPVDREFVLALLATWPEVASRLPPALREAGANAQQLDAAAANLLRDAQRAMTPPSALSPGGLVRRVARRLRHRDAPAA